MALTDSRVALITGASSGIGLALAQYLLSKSTPRWHVAMVDVNPLPDTVTLPETVLFMKCDVADWDQQAAAFKRAFEWHSRLDFAALNAGIDDRDDIFNSIDHSLTLQDGPRKPNMATFEINLNAVYYGIKLAAHYFSASPPSIKDQDGERGNMVLTASVAGLYPSPGIPQYSATKEALISLTRSLSPSSETQGIRINTLCPSMVPTALAPLGLMDIVPEECVTPMSTILRAYDEMMDPVVAKNGGVCEASIKELYWREEDGWKPVGPGFWQRPDLLKVWGDAYKERNRRFAMHD